MIYFDAAYIAKCYLNEPGAERVRAVARQAPGLASCELGRLEFACILHRHRRERHVTAREARAIWREFTSDERTGVWQWLPVTFALVARTCNDVRRFRRRPFLRAGDALHLACARENGFKQVYTNDRHMLAGSRYFGLAGLDVLATSRTKG